MLHLTVSFKKGHISYVILDILRIPESECPTIWMHLPRSRCQKSWDKIRDPVVPTERNLYGDPLAVLL